MAEQPLVSVLMTAYNRKDYVGDAVRSVLQSTYKNFELIVVDDCSDDSTADLVRNLEQTDSRIKLYVNHQNLGDYPNRNKAASYARGKYLKYLDSDDLIYPHGLEVFVSSIEKFPDAGLCVGYNGVQLREPFPVCIPRLEALRQHFFNTGILNTGPSGTIISRKAFERIGGFSGKRMVGDTELWFTIACHYDVVIAQPSLVYWRQHDGQEFYEGVRSGLYTEMTMDLITELMLKDYCTLTVQERCRVLTYFKKLTARQVLKSSLKKSSMQDLVKFNKRFGLRFADYLNGILNVRRKLD